jgi:NAD(P)-dependent dehydrogenase (short-subunit alcohol dehydrogenase family)
MLTQSTSTNKSTTRNALVVGANTSISSLLIERLISSGFRVLATTRRVSTSHKNNEMLEVAELDLLKKKSFDSFVKTVVPAFGEFDLVLFLTGILPGKSLSDYDDILMEEVMTINFTSQAALLRRLIPNLKTNSLVLMVSSVSGERGSFDPIYAASKAAQIAFVKSLATWLAPSVRVNAIAPSLIKGSSMYEAMTPERRAHHLEQTPTQRLTTMSEIANIIVDLCSPAWKNLNGQVISINGGMYV